MFQKLRQRIGEFYFKKNLLKVHRERRLSNLENAKRIGILYMLRDVPDYEIIESFVAQLQHERKEVKALGYVKYKTLVSRFLPKLSYDFFSRKDISYFFQPVHGKVKDFIEQDFDILIDLSLEESFPLKYISGLSHAHCRVGRYSDKNLVYYDLMLEVKPDISLEELIRQITHYLTIINSNA